MLVVRNLWFYVKCNRIQVLLCSLSMAIAVVCMHLIGSMSHIVEQELMKQVSLMGTDLLMGYVYEGLDLNYLDTMQDIGLIDSYSLMKSDVYSCDDVVYTVKSVSPTYFSLYQMRCSQGRLFTIYDSRVVVLGMDVEGYSVGDAFVYNHEVYRVIGILDGCSESFYGDDNACIFIPYVHNGEYQILMKTDDEVVCERYLSWCLKRYDLLSQSQIKEGMSVLWNLLERILLIIAGVSLVVSLVGILSVSLLNVNSRMCEIGIRKTIGASDASLFVQLILEVIIVGVVGFGIGSLLSILFVGLLCWYLGCLFYMSIQLFGVLFILCLVVGILGGVVPAYVSSKKDVVDVLNF